MVGYFKPGKKLGPEFLFVIASLAVLLSIAPQVSHAAGDPRVGKLISQSGVALHLYALRSIGVVHAEGSVVADGLSGSGDSWNEMGRIRVASLFSAPPLGGGSGWDGNENWNLDQTGLVIVDGSVLGRSSAVNQAYFGNYDLWTPSYGGATVAWGGSKSEKGKSYDVLTVTPPKSNLPIEVWFDRATHLPVKAVQTAGPIMTTITMADFKTGGRPHDSLSRRHVDERRRQYLVYGDQCRGESTWRCRPFGCSEIVAARFLDSGRRDAGFRPDPGFRESRVSRRHARQ